MRKPCEISLQQLIAQKLLWALSIRSFILSYYNWYFFFRHFFRKILVFLPFKVTLLFFRKIFAFSREIFLVRKNLAFFRDKWKNAQKIYYLRKYKNVFSFKTLSEDRKFD